MDNNLSENLAIDAAGNLLVGSNLCCILRLNPDGSASRIAGVGPGGPQGYSGDGGPATKAQLSRPQGMAFDTLGNLYIADSNNMRVRKIGPDGIIETVAGNGAEGYSGDGGPALSAQVSADDVALDTQGNLYFTDSFNAVVRMLKADGTIVTMAGISGQRGYSGDGGPVASARLIGPTGIAADRSGNLYLADGYRIRKVTPDGRILTIAGTGTQGHSGDGGPATKAQIEPWRIAVDRAGNVYIPELHGFVRKVSPDGTITTVAGGGRAWPGDGGLATDAQLGIPTAIAVDSSGNLFFGDRLSPQFALGIRKVTPAGIITLAAGYTGHPRLGVPTSNLGDIYAIGLAFDPADNLYITDGCRIWKLATDGAVVPVAGYSCGTYSGDSGAATKAGLLGANGIAALPDGRVFFADGPANEALGVGTGAVRLLQPPDAPLLSVGATLPHRFNRLQTGFTLLVNNGGPIKPTSGTVTVTEFPPDGTTVVSMTGPGWNCSGNACMRSDSLRPGETYSPITVILSPVQSKLKPNKALVSGGGSPDFSSTDYIYDITAGQDRPPAQPGRR